MRLLLAAPFIVSFAILVTLALANRRTLFGDRTDDLSDYGSDEHADHLGIGGSDFINHVEPTSRD